jgi:rRNA maturation protein Nop10
MNPLNTKFLAYCQQCARVRSYTMKETANESGQKVVRKTCTGCGRVTEEVIKGLGEGRPKAT